MRFPVRVEPHGHSLGLVRSGLREAVGSPSVVRGHPSGQVGAVFPPSYAPPMPTRRSDSVQMARTGGRVQRPSCPPIDQGSRHCGTETVPAAWHGVQVCARRGWELVDLKRQVNRLPTHDRHLLVRTFTARTAVGEEEACVRSSATGWWENGPRPADRGGAVYCTWNDKQQHPLPHGGSDGRQAPHPLLRQGRPTVIRREGRPVCGHGGSQLRQVCRPTSSVLDVERALYRRCEWHPVRRRQRTVARSVAADTTISGGGYLRLHLASHSVFSIPQQRRTAVARPDEAVSRDAWKRAATDDVLTWGRQVPGYGKGHSRPVRG